MTKAMFVYTGTFAVFMYISI